MDLKLISIIVPCYNQAHFLDQTLESVLKQTYLNWECLVINDGSKDQTEQVAKKWVAKDIRFKYIYKDNGGLSSARNSGLDNAKGEYVVFLDSDDCIASHKLEESLNISIQKNLDIVISDFRMFYKETSELKSPFCNLKAQEFTLKTIVLNWDTEFTIPIHCGFFSSNLFKNVRFNESLKAKEDWFMWIEVFKQKPEVAYLDKVFAFYRKNPKSMTSNLSYMRTNTDKAYLEIYPTLNTKLQPLFLEKVFKDNSSTINYYQKKYLKYKKLTKILVAIIGVSILASVILNVF